MNNPFQSPQAGTAPAHTPGAPRGTGVVDVGFAVNEAFQALMRNLGTLWLGFLAMLLVDSVSLLMCILPAIVVVPVVGWGWNRMLLQCLEGRASMDTLFSGFQDLGAVWMRTFGVSLILGLIATAFLLVGGALIGGGYWAGEWAGLMMGILVSVPVFLAMIYVMIRFQFASWIIVDAPVSSTDAISRSWDETTAVWFHLFLLSLVLFGINMGVNIAQTIVLFPLQLVFAQVGEVGAIVGGLVSLVVQFAILPLVTSLSALAAASAYRQAVGSVEAS